MYMCGFYQKQIRHSTTVVYYQKINWDLIYIGISILQSNSDTARKICSNRYKKPIQISAGAHRAHIDCLCDRTNQWHIHTTKEENNKLVAKLSP